MPVVVPLVNVVLVFVGHGSLQVGDQGTGAGPQNLFRRGDALLSERLVRVPEHRLAVGPSSRCRCR